MPVARSVIVTSESVQYEILCSLFVGSIIPHAIFSPEFPDGCVEKSSGDKCMTTGFPTTSDTVKRFVRHTDKAFPSALKRGGKSPA